MTVTAAAPTGQADVSGVQRLAVAAGFGLAGAVAAIVIPLTFLFLAANYRGGFFTLSAVFVEVTSVLLIAGALLLLLSLFIYRRGFAALRTVDPRFYAASLLCILGSLGFLLLLISAAIVAGNTGSLLTCVHGQPSHALSCLESGQPFGAVTSLVGFLLGWIGGVGIMIGLLLAGGRFRAGTISGSGVVYGLLLLLLILPFVAQFVTVPGTSYLLIVAPVLALVGPALALRGSRATSHRLAPT